MKTKASLRFFGLLTFLIFINACTKSNFDTGIKGKVEYGSGDCMPPIDETNRSYEKFKGELVFIVKTDLDNLGNGDFENLKQHSIKTKIKRGKLGKELPPNTYVVMPENLYLYSEANTITIVEGEVLAKDFQFWNCTSY